MSENGVTESDIYDDDAVLGAFDLDYHVEFHLKGHPSEIDAHLKWVEETAALARREIIVKKGTTNGSAVIAHISTHFCAPSPLDAVFMGAGLLGPRRASVIEVTGIIADRTR